MSRIMLSRRRLMAGARRDRAASPAVVRAQGCALKVGVLRPRSGAQAESGRTATAASRLPDRS